MSRGTLTWQTDLPRELKDTATTSFAVASGLTSYRVHRFGSKYLAVAITAGGQGPGTINHFIGELDSEDAAQKRAQNDWDGGARD